MAISYVAIADALGHLPGKPMALPSAGVSFRSATANAWGASFLRHLSAELGHLSRPDRPQLMAQTCSAAQAMFNTRCDALPDMPSHTVLGVCSLIVSAYWVLVGALGSAGKAFEIVERAFDRTYRAFIKNVCKPLLQESNDSLRTLATMNFRSWSEYMGKGDGARARGARDVMPGSGLAGYHFFFRAQGELGLARIIDTADQAWIDAVAAHAKPLSVERRRKHARGTDFSPFRFGINAQKPAPATSDVVLELQVNAPAGWIEIERRCSSHAAELRRNRHGADRRRLMRPRDEHHVWSSRNPVDRRARSRA